MNRRAIPSALVLLAGCAGVPQGTSSTPVFTTQPLAESVTSDLPRIARPLHYRIDISPDAAKLTFTGRSSVDLEVFEATDTLTLNALELDIASATLLGANGAGPARDLSVKFDAGNQTVIPKQTIELSRDYSFDETQALGIAAQEEEFKKDLERDMVAAILRRLEAAGRAQGH